MSPLVLSLVLFSLLLSVNANPCTQEIVTGPCRAYFQRYGYDSKQKACVNFVYGGCEGNDNRFETKEDCEAKCLWA